MITREQQVEAANRAATAAQFAIEAKGRNWCEALKSKPEALAVFVGANPAAPAEALYLSTKPKRPWSDAGAPLRVAVETFRATYLALVVLLEADPVVTQPVGTPRGLRKSAFGKVPGMRSRETFRRST